METTQKQQADGKTQYGYIYIQNICLKIVLFRPKTSKTASILK